VISVADRLVYFQIWLQEATRQVLSCGGCRVSTFGGEITLIFLPGSSHKAVTRETAVRNYKQVLFPNSFAIANTRLQILTKHDECDGFTYFAWPGFALHGALIRRILAIFPLYQKSNWNHFLCGSVSQFDCITFFCPKYSFSTHHINSEVIRKKYQALTNKRWRHLLTTLLWCQAP
jgi:hypothetical protein